MEQLINYYAASGTLYSLLVLARSILHYPISSAETDNNYGAAK